MKATLEGHYGSDLDVVNAARVSFANKSDWAPSGSASDYLGVVYQNIEGKYVNLKEKDARLIQYLARGMSKSEWEELLRKFAIMGNPSEIEPIIEDLMDMAQHWVPFTHNYIKFHMVAPVPIARQCFKSKIGFTESEESRRYIKTTPTLYIPDEFRASAENVKQGSAGKHEHSAEYKEWYIENCIAMIQMYESLIESGVAPEQARFILPQGCEVEWIWSGNLASFARYFLQRTDSHAQLESQILAKEVGKQIAPFFPVSWEALTKSGRRFNED